MTCIINPTQKVSNMDKLIFLDSASTTKVNAEVLAVYNDISLNSYANAGSIHHFGMEVNQLLINSKYEMLKLLKVDPCKYRVIFTSGATESNNLALKGIALARKNRGNHIITSSVEHPAILEVCHQLEEVYGFKVTYLPVDEFGKVRLEDLSNAMTNETILVSIMAVNNEIGSINDVKGISEIIKKYPKCSFHSDVTQAIGKIAIPYEYLDAFSFSGHKIHALKGSGALIIKSNINLVPQNAGGGQEDNFRSGTVNVAGSICLYEALKRCLASYSKTYNQVSLFYKEVDKYILSHPDLYEKNTFDNNPYIYNFSLKTKKAAVIVEGLSTYGIMVSSTSACHAKNEAGSYVVKALGKSDVLSNNTIRVSFDESNTLEEVQYFISCLDKIVNEVRNHD